MYTSTDVKGIRRGACSYDSSCGCDGYIRLLADSRQPGQPGVPYQVAWCAYCGHSPVNHARLGPVQQSASTLAGPNQAEGAAGLSQPPVSTAILLNQPGEAAEGPNPPPTSRATLTDQTEAAGNGLSQPSTSRATLENQGGGAAHLTVGTDQPGNTALVEKATRCGAVTTSRQAEKVLHSLTGQHVCYMCGFFCNAFSVFASHTKTHQGGNAIFECTLCNSKFAFLTHYKEHHRVCKRKWASHTDLSQEIMSDDNEGSMQITSEDLDESEQGAVVRKMLTSLCRRLEGHHRCPKTVVDDVVQEVDGMFNAVGVSVNTKSIKNDRLRKKLYQNAKIFVPPTEVMLTGGKKAYIIKLLDLLNVLLSHPDIVPHVRKVNRTQDDGIIRDFTDGARFCSHPVFQKQKENIILLSVYYDDVELSNPLGMKRGKKGKLSMFYVTLLNLPPQKRSKLSNIFLLGTGHTASLKQHSERLKFFDDFLHSLNLLANEGVVFETDKGSERFFGALMTITGDALATHSLAGFKQSFSPSVYRSCRTCLVPTAEYVLYSRHGQCNLRTEGSIRMAIKNLNDCEDPTQKQKLSKESGINSDSVLTSVPFFSLTKDILYDPMHLLLEGVVPKEICLFLRIAIREKKWFTRKQINAALTSFQFHRAVSTSDRPRQVEKDLTLVSSASASLVMILHFPLIVEELIPEDTINMRCLIQLAQITQILLSPVLTAEAVGDLEELIASHHQLFIECYGNEAIFPKMHMLIHIVDQVRKHGPARHHWTMRMEAKNALPKSKKIFNFRNVPFSVSDFIQTNTSYVLWNDDGTPKTGYADTKIPPVCGTPCVLSQKFCDAGLALSDVGQCGLSLQKAPVENVVIRVNDVVVTGRVSEQPCFCKVHDIVCFNEKIFLNCRLLTTTYVSKVNAFLGGITGHEAVLSTESLLLPWPVFTYAKDNNILCIPQCIYTASHV